MNFFDDADDMPFSPANISRPWTLAEIYADLGAKHEICKTLNVTRSRVHMWLSSPERAERIGIPRPLRRLGNVNIYSMQEWKDWLRAFERKHENDPRVTGSKPFGSGESFWEHFAEDRQ